MYLPDQKLDHSCEQWSWCPSHGPQVKSSDEGIKASRQSRHESVATEL